MTGKILKNKVTFSLLMGALVLCHVLWEYTHGGVTAHNLLAREDLPAISNWWGLLTVPVLSYFLLHLIQKRIPRTKEAQPDTSALRGASLGLLLGLVFGIAISLLWMYRMEDVLAYIIYLPFIAALFAPVYRPEYLLGFALGMVYTFGGVLPFLVGFVLVVISFIIYKLIRGGFLWLVRRVGAN